MKHFRFVVWGLLLGATFIAGGIFFSDYSSSFRSASGVLSELTNNGGLQADALEVYDFLKENFYHTDALENEDALKVGAVQGLVNALDDPYTVFYSEEEYTQFNEELQGKFEGIGAEIGIQDDQVVVVAPLSGTPAEQAGLKPKDAILSIDGEVTTGMTVEQAVSKIRGEKGTEVVLGIVSEGERDPREVKIIRGVIDVPNMKVEVRDSVGIISLRQFQEGTTGEVSQQLVSWQEQGVSRIVLDLRSNPGGYLQEAVSLVDLFVDAGKTVVSEVGRDGVVIETFKTKGSRQFEDVEVVVLINGGSASASEITAAALHELESIPIVGEKSFGKGVVQQIRDFEDLGVLKYTVAEWKTPDGNSIHEVGLEPNEKVELSEEDLAADRDPQLDRALEIVKGQ